MTYFKNLLDLLKIEWTEDRNQYLKFTESSSVVERRANGLAWYPIAIRGSEMSRGDYLAVEVERTTHQDIPHQLRFGMPAVLFSNYNSKEDRVEGTISHQNGNRLRITLKTDELPAWSRDGKLGIDVLFDDNSYQEMQEAVKAAQDLMVNEKEGYLTRMLIGEEHGSNDAIINPIHIASLNTYQNQAFNKILYANELAIVHGPPGTGKTTTLVQAIKALTKKDNQKILVVAPSNTAVDLLSEKLFEEGLNVVRIGNPVRVSERLISLTLDSKVSEHSYSKDIKRLKKQAQEYKNMAHKYKRSFGRAEREQRKLLFEEAHKIMREVDKSEQYIVDDILEKAQVVTATLVGATHYTVRNINFHTVVIDEAGQALEPACWIPILKAKKLILAGDHCQLSPTIKSDEAARNGLSTTLLEKCVALHPEKVTLLREQYRMNEAIMAYSSKVFYEDKLQAHRSVAKRTLKSDNMPLLFIDTAGCGFDEKLQGTSTTNPEEATLLFKHLHQLVELLSEQYSIQNFPSIAIISPYKQQVNILKEQFLASPTLQLYANSIAVNTIDSFQGQERDVVYISLTRSNMEGEIGFLADTRRMNVAMTRAKKKLVMVGDSATLAQLPFYAGLIDYAEKIGGYESAWTYVEM